MIVAISKPRHKSKVIICTHSICYETHQKAKDIIEGRKIDPTFYPVIYGADEEDDWTDPKVWKKATTHSTSNATPNGSLLRSTPTRAFPAPT